MTIFSEKNELKAGKQDWKKLVESKAPPIEKKVEEKKEENNPWAICTASTGRDDPKKYEKCVQDVKAKTEESVESPVDDKVETDPASEAQPELAGEVDDVTKARIAKIEEKKAALAAQVKELEEEAAFLKEFGIKKTQLEEMKSKLNALKDEMVSMKEGKKAGKTGAAPGNPNQSGNSTWDNVTKKEDSEKAKVEKNRSRGKKEWKREVSDMEEGMTRKGKKPGKAEETDEDAPKDKKKNLKEGFERYMQKKTPAKDSGVKPDDFTIVMG